MGTQALLILRMYEDERRKWFSKPTYQEVVERLWQQGAPGITVFRDEEGVDSRGQVQNILSDYTYGLPITMEIYTKSKDVDVLCRELDDLMSNSDRMVVIPNVINAKREQPKGVGGEGAMTAGQILRVYMKEEDRYQHTVLYDAIVRKLKQNGVLWVDVQRGLEGFGEEHVIHKSRLLSFSNQAPIILEAFLEAEQAGVLEDIRPLLDAASGPALLIQAESVHTRE